MKRTKLYLGGEWVQPTGSDVLEVENPATEQIIGVVPAAGAADVDRAVHAARDAFPAWSGMSPRQRAEYLDRLWQGLHRRRDDIARTITMELGTPLKVATAIQAGLPLTVLRGYADLAESYEFTERIGHSLILKEPIGVVAAITPWNYPLHQMIAKVAPALLAGCTVVLKPAELTPFVAYLLADAVHEAELPAGVFNLVCGPGPVAGAALAVHPGVDMVSFTGSTEVGKRISVLAAENVKKVALELGGKSANVILDDADLTAAVKVGVGNALLNAGQTCMAWTRMLVPHSRYEQALELAAAAAGKYPVGNPMLEGTRLGPLSSARQRSSVLAHIETGLSQGARLVAGGDEVPPHGHYVPATVLADVKPDDVVAQEEIFGPVLAVIPFGDDDEAVSIANNSRYGLSGAVWSGDEERALAVAHRLQTGSVDINGAAFNPQAPFGGYKQSGIGRELGRYGLEEFLQTKAIQR
ncbi:aldehyde dehydrogenase family protein [Prauserella flavalba]|uniref:aldehyde dehydrogenase (NAD(+)) n=1 Tax=Prauserella flavalba TaxID=1477506 RepID=A0A318LSL8_9PSEU|nr:aldehyde dehydrogenase family protein [Prauserella flavalba]PXY25489.1 aldehyde dehydrogenase [Prauserella flavalba]